MNFFTTVFWILNCPVETVIVNPMDGTIWYYSSGLGYNVHPNRNAGRNGEGKSSSEVDGPDGVASSAEGSSMNNAVTNNSNAVAGNSSGTIGQKPPTQHHQHQQQHNNNVPSVNLKVAGSFVSILPPGGPNTLMSSPGLNNKDNTGSNSQNTSNTTPRSAANNLLLQNGTTSIENSNSKGGFPPVPQFLDPNSSQKARMNYGITMSMLLYIQV